MDDDQQFCLQWNNHQSTLVSVFYNLLEKGIHVDCTLAAEGQTLKAHKVVLSACSPYFENVLSQQYDKHPIIILKDVKYAELRAMMDYMYRGEVNISQDQLAALLKAAESLQIKGLSDNKPSPAPPAHPALPTHPAHPPRAPSPLPQVTATPISARDGSVDSRDESVSPTRRRKKARRLSVEGVAPAVEPQGNGDDSAPCKEEAGRDGVEDLTIDEEADDPPPVTHNDVVRNFQWHMERSQDEIMNSNDGVRDSQGARTTRQSIVTRSKKIADEPEKVSTFAVLKTVKSAKMSPAQLLEQAAARDKEALLGRLKVRSVDELKENKSQGPTAPKPQAAPAIPAPPPAAPTPEQARERFQISWRRQLPCAQYKTEKGFKCPNCERCYNAHKNLVRHVTLECGIEPQYKCPYCSYSKHRRNELRKHMERKHPEHQQMEGSPASAPTTPPLAVK